MKVVIGITMFMFMIVSGAFVAGGNDMGAVALFIDLPSLLVEVLGMVGLGLVAFDSNEWKSGIGMLFKKCSKDEVYPAFQFWRGMAVFSVVSSFVGLLIGVVMILQNLSDMSLLGPSLAVAMITMFYACVLYGVCRALACRAEKSLN